MSDQVHHPASQHLLAALTRLARLQGQTVDPVELHGLKDAAARTGTPQEALKRLMAVAHLKAPQWMSAQSLDRTHVPALFHHPETGWGLLRGMNGMDQWVTETYDEATQQWREGQTESMQDCLVARVSMVPPFQASSSKVYQIIRGAVKDKRGLLFEVALGGLVINAVALASSLYSMQVYDRVVPTGATGTLLALTLGVLGAISFELLLKFIRSHLNERVVDEVDQYLARVVYTRFLAIRMDQMPNSVGVLSGQLRGYETVRGFLASLVTQMMIDIPFALVYAAVVLAIAGALAWVPLAFLVVSLLVGLTYRKRIDDLTSKSTQASNFKTGLLVESVEGAETIKSGQGGWRMLSRWLQVSDEARAVELDMRHTTEHSQYWIAALHQYAYVILVAMGAMMVARGEISMGALIACSILSGRILGPIGSIPNLLIQWGHCKTSLQSLDRLFALQSDHHGVDAPLQLDRIRGHYEFEQVQFAYGNQPALVIPRLTIRPGEKIGVLGPVGAGKTSLLRMLSGMYRPQQGSIQLDGVDLSHIAKPLLAEQMGFLQQDGRLFAGTLRDNLVLGLLDPGDQAILEAATLTGLQEAVLKRAKQGLQHPVHEGGQGLSGGQRQLVNLTRVFLRRPRLWLLDEPTASMDRNLEAQVIRALHTSLRPDDVLVLVTHKPELLQLVDRLIVVAGNQIVLDGPKADVLAKLQQPRPTTETPAS
jgi:ATP-binding cassette subfamily C protein LapB